VFQVGDIDHISPFDGNLILTIPIGGQYPLRPGFTYGLTLFYNGKVWDVDYQPNSQNLAFDRTYEPHRGYNAGVGWTLTLGQLLAPQAVINDGNSRWTYVSPDGARHDFYSELHPGESQVGSSFTRNNSYLRMRVQGADRIVEMPDGSRHFFRDPVDGTGIWRLRRLEDAFGNWLIVDYGTVNQWILRDLHGREHRIFFSSDLDPLDKVVEAVHVERFGSGAAAVWDFVYDDISLDPGECGLTTDPLGSPRFDMRFLSEIVRPDGSSFLMPDYAIETDQPSCGPSTGRIRSLTLPTGGELEWDYGAYVFPRENCQSCAGNFTPNESVSGVHVRRHRDASGTLLGTWTYDPLLLLPIEGSELVTTVTQPAPLDHETVYYFSVHRHTFSDFNDDWTRYEYGLPFTRDRTLDGDFPNLPGAGSRPELLLSREIFDGDGALLRSVYVRYARELPLSTQLSDVQNANRRLEHEVTIYHDDDAGSQVRFTETFWSDFDGLGNYRTQTRRGNFINPSALQTQVSHTEWNPARGQLVTDPSSGQQAGTSTFTLPSASAPWVLGTSSFTESRETGTTRRTEREYTDEGFLECERRLVGTQRSANDVVQVFADANADGSPESESTYGGDLQAVSTAAGCSGLPTAPEYKTRFAYAHGALRESAAVKTCAGGATEEDVLQLTDLDIDANTGLARTSRDAAGTPTDFTYDLL
ncbi:MAG: hypothetical protein AAGF23_25080, partial [Acidobacteriota bacterium]